MKVLCDVHIAYKVVSFFVSKGIEALHVNSILDKWKSKDKDICMYADANNFAVLTKDSDFRDSHFLRGTPKKVIKVNLGNISTNILVSIVDENISTLISHFEKEKCYAEINRESITFITS
ncbi:MAG: DUF5615 family PIN-like protein [Ignavibacteriales bacterium]|nr:DUF5615 family PIN-like protein [Ignavibacteriales bacterium]